MSDTHGAAPPGGGTPGGGAAPGGGAPDPKLAPGAAGGAPDPKAAPGGAPAPKPGDGTVLGGGDAKGTAAAGATPGTWPTDWREQMAGGDAKELERLKRFAAPGDVYKGFREAEGKITSGTVKNALPENATPEQLATWRKENGIPDKPEGYEVKLSNGIVPGEADKPLINEFLKTMHDKNAPPTAVNAALDVYYGIVAKQAAERTDKDAKFHDTTLLELGKEYGGELDRNLAGVTTLLGKHFPADVAANLLAARMPDDGGPYAGRLLGDVPGIAKGFIALMKDAMPGATLVPAGSSNIGKSVSDELSSLQGLMKDYNSAYWKGPDAAKNQERYRQLLDAEQAMKGRSA